MLSLISFPQLIGNSEANEGSSLARMLILWHVFSIFWASSVLLSLFLCNFKILSHSTTDYYSFFGEREDIN